MSHVREVIELLTRVFKNNGTTAVKAECFRSAKFNKDDTTAPLWRLLFELVYILYHGKLEDYMVEVIGEIKPEEMIVYTKMVMQEHGYFSLEFSHLPDDTSSGSREVLLAIGWLLSSKKLVDKLVHLHTSVIEEEFPPIEPVIIESTCECMGKLGPVQRARQLQLLNGRIYLSLKSLYSLYREETKLQHRIHECTRGVSTVMHRPHLSAMEVCLLRHPEQLKRCIKQLEADNMRLEQLIQWKEHEHIFWKWMESVLELKMEELAQPEEQDVAQPVIHYNIAADLLGSVSMARRSLESAIIKCEPVITELEELWETRQFDICEEEMKKLEFAVNSEIQLYQIRSAQNIPPLYRNSRLVFTKPSQKKSSNVQIPAMNNCTPDGSDSLVDIQLEITKLEEHINRLECEVRRKERLHRHELDKIASDIPGAVCIHPASLRR